MDDDLFFFLIVLLSRYRKMYRREISMSDLATLVASRQFCPGDNFVTRCTKSTQTPGRQITLSVNVYSRRDRTGW